MKAFRVLRDSLRVSDTMDFSSMTLTQIKRQEMDAQVSTPLGKIQFRLIV